MGKQICVTPHALQLCPTETSANNSTGSLLLPTARARSWLGSSPSLVGQPVLGRLQPSASSTPAVLPETAAFRAGSRCFVEDRSSKVAWLNRSGIIFAGEDKWSLDPRVELEKRSPLEYSLRIQKVDVYDEGSYTCSVQTQHHPKTSQVYLIVQVPPKISNISSDITVNEGSNVTLVCMANGRPEPVITWRHLTPTGKEFEGEEEYLEILGITREQSGKYECKAANEVASADVKQVRVTVNYPPTITESKSNEAATGRQALLRCEASAVPTPDFEWYRDDTRINSANGLEIKSTGSQSLLMVANVTEEHYGNYTCVAANKLGVTNASLYLYKRVLPTLPNPFPGPGTGRVDNGSVSLAVPLWLLAASLLCLLSKC
ncbi:limbic system-associated membrane protein isoform X1 [Gallus gallus]|uniref:limbic system-associated membrane protein isoform X1 n=1 Tax=Gallus gallus TaxID=9031 RepID=UPI001AE437F7|nr:limbic system-associated membrane protein isoform X1 [Gallus gallus]XP_046762642.1 limbic system-associated membrane protein isoform X1 [Gallus gallus]